MLTFECFVIVRLLLESFFKLDGGGVLMFIFLTFTGVIPERLDRVSTVSILVLYFVTISAHPAVHGKIEGISPYCLLPVTKCNPHTWGLDAKLSLRIASSHSFFLVGSLGIT